LPECHAYAFAVVQIAQVVWAAFCLGIARGAVLSGLQALSCFKALLDAAVALAPWGPVVLARIVVAFKSIATLFLRIGWAAVIFALSQAL